jgi:hypothetical protein
MGMGEGTFGCFHPDSSVHALAAHPSRPIAILAQASVSECVQGTCNVSEMELLIEVMPPKDVEEQVRNRGEGNVRE